MRKLHDSIESRSVNNLKVQVKLDNGDVLSIARVDQVYVSEDGKHVIVHSVLTTGSRRIDTFTTVVNLLITGA